MDAELESLLQAARERSVSDAERQEQRVNFAYGNAKESDTKSTKESVRLASLMMKAA